MGKPKIVGIGELLWDVLPAGRRLGGAPVNFAFYAQEQGAEACIVSAVGQDASGDELLGGIAALGMLAASLGGIYHAWSLVAEEKLAAQGMGSCKMFMGFPEWIPLDTWLPQVFQPEGLCGEVVWTLLGQSMAVWSLALFVFCLLVLAAKLAFGRRTA